MRVRAGPLLALIFGSATAAAAFVVSRMPRQGQVSPPARVKVAAAPDQISPPLEPAATAHEGAVEVRVTAGGEPLAGADVRLYLAPVMGGPWRRAGESKTERNGIARLPSRPGAYLVAARAPGLAPGRREVARMAGESASHADVALEQVVALNGRILARGGGPVAGAKIRAIPFVARWPGFDPPSAPPEETAVATSSAAGTFLFDGLSPGTWAVTVEAPGYHPVLIPRATVPEDELAITLEPLGEASGTVLNGDGRPAAGAVVRAASVDHGASARTGPDGRFVLAAPAGRYALSASLGERAGAAAAAVTIAPGAAVRGIEVKLGAGASVEGAVVRAGGGPASGAEVALFWRGTTERMAPARAGADGRFTLRGLAPGAYDLRAIEPGSSLGRVDGVVLGPGARFPIRITLRGTGAVEGTIRDAAGRPLAGVRVRAVQAGENRFTGAAEARTDFEGAYRLDGLELGRTEIVARPEGVLLGIVRAVEIGEGRVSRLDLLLPDAGFVVGRVSEQGRPPPPGTTVIAIPRAGPRTHQVARAIADPDGRYRLTLPAGQYRVLAAPGPDAAMDRRVAPGFARVDPGQTSRLDLVLAPEVREQGVDILVLEPGGAPSPGAIVMLTHPDDGRIALATSAGDDGRVAIGSRMGFAGQQVTIRARNGGRTGAETLELPASGTISVHLSPGGTVVGIVRGARVGGFTLEVSSEPTAQGWRTLESHRFAGDRFELVDLPPEPLRLNVHVEDGRRGTGEVRVAPGERRTVQIAVR